MIGKGENAAFWHFVFFLNVFNRSLLQGFLEVIFKRVKFIKSLDYVANINTRYHDVLYSEDNTNQFPLASTHHHTLHRANKTKHHSHHNLDSHTLH